MLKQIDYLMVLLTKQVSIVLAEVLSFQAYRTEMWLLKLHTYQGKRN